MEITVKTNSRLQAYAQELAQIASRAPNEMAKSLNRVGNALRQQTIAAEARQTGLPQKVIRNAQQAQRADAANLRYRITAAGGNIALRFFRAREVNGGVASNPLAAYRFSPSAFIRGGQSSNRVPIRLGGGSNVYQREGKGRGPLRMLRSNVFLGEQLVQGQTAQAFEHGADLAAAVVMRDLAKLLP